MKIDSFLADQRLFQILSGRTSEIVCDVGRTLFKQGDPPAGLYVIREGEASLLMFSPSEDIIASFRAGPGSVLGLPAVIASMNYSLCANVRKGSKVGFLRAEDLHELLREDPSLYSCALSLLASEVLAARTALLEFISYTAERKTSLTPYLSEVHWIGYMNTSPANRGAPGFAPTGVTWSVG